MFVRPCWIPVNPEDARALIAANPWALLVSNGEDGPEATNLPLLIDNNASASEDTALVLVSHLSRANHHLRNLRAATAPVLAIFHGPWSYVTASWYPDRQMPSTYYYTAVHCYGRLEFQDEPALDAALEDLVDRMEKPYESPWRTGEIPRSEIARRLPAIAGFRMHVSKIEAKYKLGQDEPVRDALAVANRLQDRGGTENQMLAKMIRQQNAPRLSENSAEQEVKA